MFYNQPKFKYAYLIIDSILLTAAFWLSATLTYPSFWFIKKNVFNFYYTYFCFYVLATIIFIFTFLYNDLYKRNKMLSSSSQFYLLIKSILIAVIINVLIMTVLDVEYLAKYGRTFFINYTILNVILFLIFRVIFIKKIFIFFLTTDFYKRRVLIIGGDDAAKYVFESLKKDPIYDFKIIGFLDDYKNVGEEIHDNHKNLGKLEDIVNVVKKHKIDEIIIAIDNTPYDRIITLVENCLETNKVVRIYSNFLEVIARKLNVEYYSNIPVIMLSQYPIYDFSWMIKRTIDCIIAFFLLVLFSPIFFGIAIGIKLSSKGPVIFKQKRIGKNGREFTFYKFRSMYMEKDDSQHREFVKKVWFNKENNTKSQEIYRIIDDPRIFKFGRLIRKTSLDELPQLYNVLKGEMSLVGPRPCMPFEWEMYEEWHKNRMNILPGCTGLWQAMGRATVSFEEMVILDLYYISNMTLWLDLKIIFKTIPVIIFGKGGY
jgi:undecaprenyl-phosphate galactose phosphotransferase